MNFCRRWKRMRMERKINAVYETLETKIKELGLEIRAGIYEESSRG